MYESRKTDLHVMGGGVRSQCLNVYKDPYLSQRTKQVYKQLHTCVQLQETAYFSGHTRASIRHTSNGCINQWWTKLALRTKFVTYQHVKIYFPMFISQHNGNINQQTQYREHTPS